MRVLELAASDHVDAMTRQSAAVTFKNMVKKNWDPSEPDEVGAVKPRGRARAKRRAAEAPSWG